MLAQPAIPEQSEYWLSLAFAQASLALEQDEVPVGAVVVLADQIIGQGFNQPRLMNDPTAHAEIVALRQAANRMSNYRLPGAQLYTTLEPCVMCAGAILNCRIDLVVFAAFDHRFGAAGSVVNVFAKGMSNHHCACYGGMSAKRSKTLLQAFFQNRRKGEN